MTATVPVHPALHGQPRDAPTRFARWRRLSERAEWRLTEHFFRAMFDFGILTEAGADSFKRLLAGAVGGFVALGLLLTRAYMIKYRALAAASSPEPYRRALLGDDLLIIGLPMLLAAFVTLLVSHSLFPDERDFRILGPLPVRRSVVFGTKLAALLLFTGSFIFVAHVSLAPLMLLTSLNRWGEHAVLSRLTAWAVASASASAFAVLAVTAVVGVLVLALSRSRLHALTAMMRSTVLAMLVACVPLITYLPALGGSFSRGSEWMVLVPPAWFLGLQRVLLGSGDPWLLHLTTIALAVVGAAALIVAVSYTRLFRHFERLMLRSDAIRPPWARSDRTAALTRATPAFRAIYRFTTATLRRSHLHQGVLVGLSACGASIAMTGLIGADLAGSWQTGGLPPSSLVIAAKWTPFALMFACGIGVRAALALPLEHRANWIFRLTEDEGTRGDQMRAVDQVVTAYVAGVPVAAAIPLFWVALGPMAVIAATVVALVGLVFVHAVLLDWRRIPFTCSYLPGKRFIAHSTMVGFAACLLFMLTSAALLHAASTGARPGLVIATALSLIAFLLRRQRLAIWRKTPLMFEDEFPDQLLQLRL